MFDISLYVPNSHNLPDVCTTGYFDDVLFTLKSFFINLDSQSGNDVVLERANSSTELKIEISLKYI